MSNRFLFPKQTPQLTLARGLYKRWEQIIDYFFRSDAVCLCRILGNTLQFYFFHAILSPRNKHEKLFTTFIETIGQMLRERSKLIERLICVSDGFGSVSVNMGRKKFFEAIIHFHEFYKKKRLEEAHNLWLIFRVNSEQWCWWSFWRFNFFFGAVWSFRYRKKILAWLDVAKLLW